MKSKRNPSVMRLFKEITSQSKSLVLITILLICAAIGNVAAPILMASILNNNDILRKSLDATSNLRYNINWQPIQLVFTTLLLLYAAIGLFNWSATWIIEKVIGIWTYNERNKLKVKLDNLPLSYFDKYEPGEILARLINDINNVGINFSYTYKTIVSSVTTLLVGTVAMFITSWQLALVLIGFFPITLGICILIARKSKKQFRKYRAEYGKLEALIEESYSGRKIIKLFNNEEATIQKFDETNKVMTEADRKSQWISGFIHPMMRFMYNITFVAISYAAGLISKENIGDLVAFIMFLNIMSSPFQELGEIAANVQSMVAAIDRVYKVMDEKEMEDETGKIDDISLTGNISFKNVTFSYDNSYDALKDFSLNVEAGDTIAIVGPTGAGKTTIINLLMRFYEINKGSIYLDGINISDISKNCLRKDIGMVLQDTWLFKGTIEDNIKYGKEGATLDQVIEASKLANADKFINSLPNQYQFKLGEEGENISQGQKQLITIARAIISDPKILILDEATSSVDSQTEKLIQNGMEQLKQNRTCFIIAHRLSTIKNAKRILVINEGKLVEQGNHEELLQNNGYYAELYNSQFLEFN